jgi:hypothetical protein
MIHLLPSRCVGLVLIVAAAGCTNRSEPATDEIASGRMHQILFPDRSKRSPFEARAFQSKQLSKKEFGTQEASVRKEFHGADSEFHSAASQGEYYSGQRSRFQEAASPLAGKSARTFTSHFQDDKARTKEYYDADKVAATKRLPGRRTAFKAGDYREASRAQENPIRGSDLAIGEVEGGPPGGTSDTGRSLTRPADLRPDSGSPIGRAAGKTMSIDDIRRLLNKGSR